MIPRKGKPPCHALLSGEEISGLTMNPKIIRDDGIDMVSLALGYNLLAIRAASGHAPVRQCSCRAYYDESLRDCSQRLPEKKTAATYSPTGVQYHRRGRA